MQRPVQSVQRYNVLKPLVPKIPVHKRVYPRYATRPEPLEETSHLANDPSRLKVEVWVTEELPEGGESVDGRHDSAAFAPEYEMEEPTEIAKVNS